MPTQQHYVPVDIVMQQKLVVAQKTQQPLTRLLWWVLLLVLALVSLVYVFLFLLYSLELPCQAPACRDTALLLGLQNACGVRRLVFLLQQAPQRDGASVAAWFCYGLISFGLT
jgi:hypothetical protein